jgi:lysozyme family protein
MASFDTAFNILSDDEGGYANDSDDSGGETYRGISRNNFPLWEGWKVIDSFKAKPNFPKNLNYIPELGKMVYSFYKKEFWATIKGDAIKSQRLANKLLSLGVLLGVHTGIKCLQRATYAVAGTKLDGRDDGIVGERTLFAVNNFSEQTLLPAFKSECAGMLRCKAKGKYIDGWLNRAYE